MAAPVNIVIPSAVGSTPAQNKITFNDSSLDSLAADIGNSTIPTNTYLDLASFKNLTSNDIFNTLVNRLDDASLNGLYSRLTLNGQQVTNKSQLKQIIDYKYRNLNSVNKFAGMPSPSINTAHFNIYDLLDPVVLRRVTALKAKQLKNAMVTQQNIQNWMGMPGAQTVEITLLRGGASLDPNVPLEMRGRGRVLFGESFKGGFNNLWQPLEDEGRMSEQFQDALDRASARLGARLADATKNALNTEIANLKAAEDYAKVKSDQLKSVVSAFANGKITRDINNTGDLKNIADIYNATLAQISSKTNKITKALTLIINQS
jgi:hypothetical protein